MLLSTFTLSGCLDDGDETITLEYGNPKKLIVGGWIVGTHNNPGGNEGTPNLGEPGTIWIFNGDGTFGKPTDDKPEHTWILDDGYDPDSPYHGGITLDGDPWNIETLGPDIWILVPWSCNYPNGIYWILNRHPIDGDGNTDDDDDDDGGKEEPTSSLITKIVAVTKYYSSDRVYESVLTFSYDGSKVAGCNWGGESVSISTGNGYVYFDSATGTDYTCKLNSNGNITSWTNNNSLTTDITYDSYNYITTYGSNKYSYDRSHTLTTYDGESIKFSSEDNDANLNLNYLLLNSDYHHSFSFDIQDAAGAFGYLGQRQSKLISEIRLGEGADYYYKYEYERDSKGRISKMTRYDMDSHKENSWFNTTEYTIYYEQ